MRRYGIALTLAAIVAIGAVLRFYHLDWKVYGRDEVSTSLRSAGHLSSDLHEFVYDGRLHRISDLRRLQGYDPSRSAWATVVALARDEPQHPPPFFLLQRAVAQTLGDSVWMRRLPSALFGTAAIAAAFWLALRLFRSARAALLAAALVATSPYHVVLAQTAREYSLWLLITCVSSALFLEALHAQRRSTWWLYGCGLAAGFWTFPLFGVVAVAHVIFVLCEKRSLRTYAGFAASLAGAILAFVPWLAVGAANHRAAEATQGWLNGHAPITWLTAKLGFNLGLTFFDFDFVDVRSALLLLPAFACVVIGFAVLARSNRHAFAFISASLGASLALGILDFIFPASRSTVPRYFVPACLALELAAVPAFLVAWNSRRIASRVAAGAALAYVLGTAAACSLIGDQARFWWYASADASLARVARTLMPRAGATIVYADNGFMLCTLLAEGVDGAFQVGGPIRTNEKGPQPLLIGSPRLLGRVVSLRLVKPVPLAVVFPRQSASTVATRRALAQERGGASLLSIEPLLWRLRAAATSGSRTQRGRGRGRTGTSRTSASRS